ncbi:hypothetical protein N7492_010255 [Penicillium capsulatum]|uniref:Zn(2)-C6 fungal-type domain-containing protein n=1 Tax=Penicillium capsulatum TaxID=69766 RepID=A0A9W9HNN0_9EURO|nr:hypothetical protein N7492_010255 [Penicillium capsulatum]KAJ6112762.1 hypothetical protein N7512_008086 [Penicillium capsulatum]
MASTGCRTCRIRKVKCDEEKQQIQGYEEPQCRKCSTAQIRCEWKGGPIVRKSTSTAGTKRGRDSNATESKKLVARQPPQPFIMEGTKSLIPPKVGFESHAQAANSLVLSPFDRECINYFQNSTLVVMLGKQWPWSTIAYAYHRIAVKEPMVMSVMLASAAKEIRQSQLYDQEGLSEPSNFACDLDGSMHYSRALSSLRRAITEGVSSPDKIEAIYVTLWMMIDYENRFGSETSAVNIHIQGVRSMLQNHVVPLLQSKESRRGHAAISPADNQPMEPLQVDAPSSTQENTTALSVPPTSHSSSLKELKCTSVPLFFLWTLYFFTPGPLFAGQGSSKLDTDIFQFFFGAENHMSGPLTLPELYRISRQSPARFWGDSYPLSAQLDDVENLPGLTLYHRSHVVQFKTTELFKSGWPVNVAPETEGFSYQWIINEIKTLAVEYDAVITSVRISPSCDTGDPNRRVLETNFWATITFYSSIVYFHLCFQDSIDHETATEIRNSLMPLSAAVSQVLELSLKLHRSRPRVLVRITWPLFIAGIATSDHIYKDWVSIRLKELGRYGQNYSRISERFDEMTRECIPMCLVAT